MTSVFGPHLFHGHRMQGMICLCCGRTARSIGLEYYSDRRLPESQEMSMHPVEVEMLSRQHAERYVKMKTELCSVLEVPWKLGGDSLGAESGMRDIGVVQLVADLKAKSKAIDEFIETLKHLDMISRNDVADSVYSFLRKELRKLGLEPPQPGESNG